MSIKHKIKFKKMTEIGVHILPLAIPWTLAMMGWAKGLATILGVQMGRVPDVVSPTDDIDYQGGGAYKAILKTFL